ncbi:MAG: undecaprenyl-diphosphate phosphatase [Holosporales bacterium]|jgi:undecaprenyl-diphosphatase|nr:undecaprenyl-diphosphate phosphatase [Holosporales bacterium]
MNEETALDIAQVLWLGTLQGLTEFLPISSSAHLALLPRFLHWQDQGQSVDVFLNIGTLGALFFYLFRELRMSLRGARDVLFGRKTPEQAFLLKALVATAPVILAGWIVETFFSSRLKSPTLLASTTVLFSLILLLCDRRPERPLHKTPLRDALIIGCAQVFSLLPGASRLGVCLSAMRFLGYDREEAFRFSLFLSFPPVLGAITLKGIKAIGAGAHPPWDALMGGCGMAFFWGMMTLGGVLWWLKRGGTWTPFVAYRLILAVLVVVL